MSEISAPTPTKVAILGGGIASLLTAFELTATEDLRQRHQVTIYQMGWRLGGKLAGGANTANHNRNEEHGLHVWFGFYDNAFSCIRRCYEELQQIQPAHRYPTYLDAFKPNDFTPIGYRTDSGYGFWDFTWPSNSGTPGVCAALPAPVELIRGLVVFFWNLLRDLGGGYLDQVNSAAPLIARHQPVFLAQTKDTTVNFQLPSGVREGSLDHAIHLLGQWIESTGTRAASLTDGDAEALANYADELRDLGRTETAKLAGLLGNPDEHPILSALEINLTIVIGCFRRRYGIYRDFNLNRIDAWDLRTWLIDNGCDRNVAARSSLLRALYDIPFAYENGDLDHPNFAAGASLRWMLRSFLTYQGHALYVPQCGFGEAVIGPYYEVLRSRGVTFRFFHKLTGIQLSPDQTSIDRLTFGVQARTQTGADYQPDWFEDGLYRWPVEPKWDQIENGDDLRDRGVNFESHWCPEPLVDQLVLQCGTDFDLVVLGIAGTAMKVRNSEDTLFCRELLAASPRFRAWTGSLGTVATSGVQFWSPRTTQELGWPKAPATVGGPEPLDVWADMTPVLDTEHWVGVPDPPRSVHYLCGPVPTILFDQPSSNAAVPTQAHQQVRQQALDWAAANGVFNWPTAKDAQGGFDWNMLYDPSGGSGPARLDAQFLRINIDPTECCGTSFAGTTRHRPDAGERLFANLHIVGADTDTGINVTCVEGATISALKAARAICGSPATICHEDFMAGDFPDLSAT